jgi:uncharacterized protein (UPF0332 family)
MPNDEQFSFSEQALRRATRAFEAGFYEDAVRDAYFSSLHAAKQLVNSREGVRPTSHSGTRKRLTSLIGCGLRVHGRSVELLSRGYKYVVSTDHLGQAVTISQAQAKEFVDGAAAFIGTAKSVCE